MEKNALSNSLKDHSLSNNMPKNPWHNNNSGGCSFNGGHTCNSDHHDCVRGCSWPPRSYSCSFCKREFRSAQALGGHMNVHRRDRARLRQSPPMEFYHHQDQPAAADHYPILTLNPNPSSPNDKFPPSSSTTSATCSSLVSNINPSRHPLVSPFLSPAASNSSLGKTTVSCCLRPPPVVVKSKPSSSSSTAARAFDQEVDLCRFRPSSSSVNNINKNNNNNNNNNNNSSSRSGTRMRSSMVGTDLQLGDSSRDDNNYVDLELRLGR